MARLLIGDLCVEMDQAVLQLLADAGGEDADIVGCLAHEGGIVDAVGILVHVVGGGEVGVVGEVVHSHAQLCLRPLPGEASLQAGVSDAFVVVVLPPEMP